MVSNMNVPLFDPATQASEVSELLDAVKELIVPFIASAGPVPADVEQVNGETRRKGKGKGPRGVVDPYEPAELKRVLALGLTHDGVGKEGLLELVEKTLDYSVNTWDQGFMDKLYASTNAVGVVSELLLAVLNTNVHVYQVSPVLTLMEKHVTERLAQLIGFPPGSGGMSQPGGSASNGSSILIARNTLYPETKTDGHGGRRFTLFTSAHGHYSVEKAAQLYGFGSSAVIAVPVDEAGRMIPSELDRLVAEGKAQGDIPLYVNATAGTTVQGSFDPFTEIAAVCKRHNLWLHVDGSWGGSVIFSEKYRRTRLEGIGYADSMAINPHKMLGVPMTSSFLLVRDLKQAWKSMTLPAGYLFHNDDSEEIYDLADLTPQCGRRGDALKFFLSWAYYGTSGLSRLIDTGYERAGYLLSLLRQDPHFRVISPEPLPCWQVCFYYVPDGQSNGSNTQFAGAAAERQENTRITQTVVRKLVKKGFMVDYAPGEQGKFFRVVVHANKTEETCRRLVQAILALGASVAGRTN